MPKPKFVTALNTITGKTQTVPAHYVGNPNIFGGAFVSPDDAKPRRKKSRKGSAENPPATDEAASPETDSTPAHGDNPKE